MDKNQVLIIKNSSDIDVLDESIYNFDNEVFTIVPSITEKSTESLFRKIKQYIDSMPALQKAVEDLESKIEYIPRFDLIPEEIQSAIKKGLAEIIPCKDSSNQIYLQIRTTAKDLVFDGKKYAKNRKIKDILLSTKEVPVDVVGAMHCLSTQSQFNQINNRIIELTEACELSFGTIIQGQRDDRLAKLLSSRSNYIQAIAISDEVTKRQMLLQAICDANSARALLAYQIKSDIQALNTKKLDKTKKSEIYRNVSIAVIGMNSSVQIALNSYQVLGEHSAQIAVVKEHQTFVKQVLLKEIVKDNNKYLAWELIMSNAKSGTSHSKFKSIPIKLINDCNAFIEKSSEDTINLLESDTDEK